jgi:hypothetical protein
MKGVSTHIVVLLGLLLGNSFRVEAQKQWEPEDKFGFFLEGKRKIVRIPFEFHSNSWIQVINATVV